MGIKREIYKRELPLKYQKYNLIPTTNGVSSTVYLLDNRYVLKLFSSQPDRVEGEIELLNSISNLPIPKVIDRFTIDNQIALIYTQIEGNIIKTPTKDEVSQIGNFLKEFHKQSKNININSKEVFGRDRLKELIISSKNRTLLKYFNSIDIKLNRDGIIHGDLFIDNAKFRDGKLAGVYDFSNFSIGDFYFDLAVVSISFCFIDSILNIELLKTLLDSYSASIKIEFIEYIRYALLYYSTIRYISNYNYKELLDKLNLLKNI